jgi:hypothetical protein
VTFLDSTIRRKEDSAQELLAILLTLVSNGIITESRAVELGANVLRATSREVIEVTNQSVRSQTLPQAEEGVTIAILSRVEADFKEEIKDFLSTDDPDLLEEVKARVELTGWYAAWASYGATIRRIAEKANKLIKWVVVPDEKTCVICVSNEKNGPYTPEKLPPYPAHCNCRCSLVIV